MTDKMCTVHFFFSSYYYILGHKSRLQTRRKVWKLGGEIEGHLNENVLLPWLPKSGGGGMCPPPPRAFPIPTALEPTFVKQAQTHFCQTRKYIYLQVVSYLMFFLDSFES